MEDGHQGHSEVARYQIELMLRNVRQIRCRTFQAWSKEELEQKGNENMPAMNVNKPALTK